MGDFSNWEAINKNSSKEFELRKSLSESVLSYGIKFLDEQTGGIIRNDLVLLGAKSGHGKTELATQIAITNAEADKRVYMFALEAEPDEITRRILYKYLAQEFYARGCNQYTTERPDYLEWYLNRQNHLFEEFYDECVAKLDKLKNLHIRYGGDSFGPGEYEREVISIKDDAQLIILDHIHYVDMGGENENQEMTSLMKTIRNLSLQYSIPVVVIAHIRKGNTDAVVPSIEEFQGSSNLFKQCTRAITIAPCKDENSDATKYLTYVNVNKIRHSGSRCRFVGLTSFDIKTNTYTDKYKLGHLTAGAKEWKPILVPNNLPFWAKNAVTT